MAVWGDDCTYQEGWEEEEETHIGVEKRSCSG